MLIVDVRSRVLILLEFAVPVTYAVGALTDVVVDGVFDTLVDISVVIRVGAAILDGVNVIVLVSVMVALEFAMTVRLEESMLLY